jgi:hypothetical protein
MRFLRPNVIVIIIMNRIRLFAARSSLFSAALLLSTGRAQPGPAGPSGPPDGWATNGPVVYRLYNRATTAEPGPPVSWYPPPTSLSPDLRVAMITFIVAAHVTTTTHADRAFDHFLPGSLNNLVWTSFIAHTNGRNMSVWSVRNRPPGWPNRAPIVQWNKSSLIWGMKGLTALSPSWELEGNPGQAPITALTRRHGYARGHDMGPDRVGTVYAGRKVWFLTANNTVVQTTIKREVVRTAQASGRDYSIVLFSSDLPNSIQPMRVVAPDQVFGVSHTKYAYAQDAPCPIFGTEQTGGVSAGVPGFTLNIVKGGDSGSPDMLPMPGELVFSSGRSTSGATPDMQADMDKLCQLEGLDPAQYQLQWVDLSAYPSY